MTTYTGNIQTASMEATQDQKEVTFNDFRAAIDARVTEKQTMAVTATGGPASGQGYTIRQKEDLGRSWYLVFDEAGVGPCTAGWIGLFPTINGGLFIARNDTAFTATFKITGQGTPPTLAAGDWAIYSLDAVAGVILRVPSSAAAAVPLSYLDTDGTLTANSDTKVATQKATKTYVDAAKASAISTAEAYADSGDASQLHSSQLDTDGTLAANSDAKVASQKATKTYVDQIIAAQDAMVFKGVTDCSANPNYPAANRGDTYRVSVAGKIGGASGIVVEVGDIFICLDDSTSSGNQATVGSHWGVIQANIDGAVVGPSSATDGNFAFFNGVTGKIIKDSSIALDTDGTLAANSDAKVASQKATKTYVDTQVGTHGVKDNATSTFTAGQKGTGTSLGTKSSGTLTPTIDASNMNLQYVTNGGAFTLAAPSTAGDYTIILDITNNGSAGTISYSGWTKNPSGDTLDTTNAHAFRFFITKINGVTSATIQALQ
jgi:hypothetical protein